MKFGATLLLIPFLFTSQFLFADSYLCVAEQSTGFRHADDWASVNFKADQKLLIRPPNELESSDDKYVVLTIGEKTPLSWCEDGFNDGGFLTCFGWNVVRFNKKTLRYVSFTGGTYLTPEIEQKYAYDAIVSIGKCSKLD